MDVSRRYNTGIAIVLSSLLLIAGGTQTALAQDTSPDQVWEELSTEGFLSPFAELSTPVRRGRIHRLRTATLQQILRAAPVDTATLTPAAGVPLFLPLANETGNPDWALFRVVESPLVNSSADAPVGMKTYSGRGIDDPTLTTRFSLDSSGVVGIVLGPEGTYFIDHPSGVQRSQEPLHATFFKRDVGTGTLQDNPPRRCSVTEQQARRESGPRVLGRPSALLWMAQLPPQVRTYRLALAATAEYTSFHRQPGDTDAQARERAYTALFQTLDLTAAVYQREFSIRFRMVNNPRSLVHVTEPDGYTPDSNSAADDYHLDENHDFLNRVVGTGNYDIGHVFTTFDGGRAGLNSVCADTAKGRGATGLSRPVVGPVMAISYFAHELGHQFGANHTYNGLAAYCVSKGRVAGAAFEPGSGSTIMSYAGICDHQDVAKESDDYFHAISHDEIARHLGSTSCPALSEAGNTYPAVSADRPARPVPAQTPFRLRARGSDPDPDDQARLTYTWEEFYRVWSPSPGPPNDDTDGALRPTFRSFRGEHGDSIRSFPKIEGLLNGTHEFESFPTRSRGMTASGLPALSFRVTVRDLQGGVATADVPVRVIARLPDGQRVGPFEVVEPAANIRWPAGQRHTVLWRVANTDRAPVACTAVRILLSLDDGRTFTDTLQARTLNDGSETVLIPAVAGSQVARILIECVDHVFFNISRRFRTS